MVSNKKTYSNSEIQRQIIDPKKFGISVCSFILFDVEKVKL